MNDKEKAVAMLDDVPPHKMGYVIGYIQGLIADTAALPENMPNAETIASMREVKEMIRTGGGEQFTGSTADLFASVLAEGD